MNRVTTTLLTLLLTASLAACGGKEETSAAGKPAAEPAAAAMEDAAETMKEEAGKVAEKAEEMADAATDAAGSVADAAGDVLAAVRTDDGCTLDVEVGDGLYYSATAMSADADCGSVTVNLKHTGQLPVAAMGHNWVLVPNDAVSPIVSAGIAAGLDRGYLPDDERIIAATDLIGGGEASSVTFSLEGLSGDYTFVCTFPGHSALMKGTFSIT